MKAPSKGITVRMDGTKNAGGPSESPQNIESMEIPTPPMLRRLLTMSDDHSQALESSNYARSSQDQPSDLRSWSAVQMSSKSQFQMVRGAHADEWAQGGRTEWMRSCFDSK